MTNLNPQTQAWIDSLKLNKKLGKTSDFENGYNFGVILQKLQLSRGKKFKNSSDLACIFQNYKNVKDLLLENFGYDFPVNNIIYRTQELLNVLKDQCIKYQEKKKAATLNAATSVISAGKASLIEPREQKIYKNRQREITNNFMNQTSKLPRKIQQIEKKLDKFREQKTRHQLIALQERKQELDQYRRVVMNNRDYELNKIQNLHNLGKQKERKVYDVWAKTEHIKHNRIKVDKQFEAFQNSKKQRLAQTLRNQQKGFVDKGLEMFHLNCIRQGVQLEHDPDKPPKQEGEFNKVIVMQRIKDNIKKHEFDKKQRVKRQNKKRIDAEEAKIKSEEQWKEIHKLEDYQKKFMAHFEICQSTRKMQERKFAQKKIRSDRYANKKYLDLPPLDPQLQENRKQELIKKRLEYMKADVQILEKKWNDRSLIAEEIVQALLQVTIEGEQIYQKNEGFTYMEWQQLQNSFMEYEGPPNKKGKASEYYMDYSNFNSLLKQYVQGSESWKNYDHTTYVEQENEKCQNKQFIQAMDTLINLSYPDKQVSQQEATPLHMPLKIMFSGCPLVGKSTHSAKVAQKFNLQIIDPRQLLKEALELAKPPVQEDPKKAGKKDPKKQQPTAQKLELKQFGVKMLESEQLQNYEDATTQQLIQVLKFRLNQLFKVRNHEQQIQAFELAKEKEAERLANALKQFEEGQKKPKKDSKKGGNEIAEEPPKQNPIFFTQGFVIDNFPISEANLKLLQREINSYLSWDEKVDQNNSMMRSKISMLVPVPERVENPTLHPGSLDLFIHLQNINKEDLKGRGVGRKIDPQTKIIYHSQFNSIPDIKGFADKLVEMRNVEDSELVDTVEYGQKVRNFYNKIGFEQKIQEQKIRVCAYNLVQQQPGEKVTETFDKITEVISSLALKKHQWYESQSQSLKQKQELQKQPKQNPQQEDINKPGEQQQAKPEQEGAIKPEQEGVIKPEQNGPKEPSEKQEESKPGNQSVNDHHEQQLVNQEAQELLPKQQIKAPVQNLQQLLLENLSQDQCKATLQKFITSVEKYEEGIKSSLYQLDNARESFAKSLFEVQKNYTSIVNRLDDRAGKVLGFQENYNKLLGEQASIVRDPEASKHLIERLDELYDSLWFSIENKKNEAVRQRQNFMNSQWLNEQGQKVVEIGRKFLQTQLNYFCETIFFILTIACKVLKKPSDFMTEYLCLGISPQLEPIKSVNFDSLSQNDRLDYYLSLIDKCMETVPQWIQQKQKKMKIAGQIPECIINALNDFVRFWTAQVQKKKKIIQNKISERVLEQRSYFHALINKMNEWTIQGIKSENDFVYEIYKNMKKSIQQARKCNIKELHVKDITDTFGPIKELSLYPIPLRVYTHHRKLPVFSYMVFLEEVKSLITTFDAKINFDTFQKYLTYRKKSGLLDKEILKIDFDTVSQYLVKDGYLYYKQLAMAVLFWDVDVFDDDALSRYRSLLLKEEKSWMMEQKIDAVSEHSKQKQKDNNSQGQDVGQEENIENAQKAQDKEGEKQQNIDKQEMAQKDSSPELPESRKDKSTQQQNIFKKRKSIVENPISKRINLEDLILMEGAFDDEEQYIMKHFIFQIFRQKEQFVEAQVLLDTLSLFDQLQVLKYGDTVMMLGL